MAGPPETPPEDPSAAEPPVAERGEVTRLLQAYGSGDRRAFDRLLPLLYDDLKRVARGQLRRGRRGRTLDTTALVHEAYLKLADAGSLSSRDRGHFLAIAARAMRQILVDYARERQALKRGGDRHHTALDEGKVAVEAQVETILALDRVLDRLTQLDPRLTQVVECRYFVGMTEEETAEAVGVSLRTVQRDWMRAKAWVRTHLEQ